MLPVSTGGCIVPGSVLDFVEKRKIPTTFADYRNSAIPPVASDGHHE